MGCTEDSQGSEAFVGCGSLLGSIERANRVSGSFTCKHGYFVYVVEVSVTLAIKTSPEICDEYLGTLVEANGLALKVTLILETWKVLYQKIHESRSGVFGFFDACKKATVESLQSIRSIK